MDPLHQFEIKKFFDFNLIGLKIPFTNSALFMVLAVVSIFTLFMFGIRNRLMIPSRLQMAIESLYNFVKTLVQDNIGPEGMPYISLVLSVFLFVLFGNILGMVPYAFTFTSHIIVTFTLALFVFAIVIGVGLKHHGFHFLSIFMPEGAPKIMAPILIPIEVLSFFSRPISLSVRLFANMMAGHTILKVFAGFTVALGIFGIAPLLVNAALMSLEFLVAFLQAYVFTILTCLYLKDAIHLH
ncbi:MAG: F0F1 ATP synthase subunit A [Alphaproteobacteria bacterium 43-37]|nr:MAG: F0F1 ATP synthase subunit A [Alphaproteobacteria bacterium 43-37]